MIIAQIPRSEDLRMADLQLYDILNSEEEKEYDELRELAAQICNCPISLISFVDSDRQWFKSKEGFEVKETRREGSFCSHAILGTEVMVIEDTHQDERFFDNPLVTGDSNIRFYAGAPIVSPTGQNLGTVCVMDQQPRNLNAHQKRALEILSMQVTKLLELRLKTKVIEQRSAELVKIKNVDMSKLIRGQDEENLSVAKQLHENIAQELAAGRLYLSMAATNETNRLKHIQEANHAITSALKDVKNLSYAISPTTWDEVSISELMEGFLHQRQETQSFDLDVKVTGETEKVGFVQSINCVKITESWLQVLKADEKIKNVKIQLHIGDEIELCIDDDASRRLVRSREKKLISSIVYYRVVSMNGVIRFVEQDQNTNRFCVTFPVMNEGDLLAPSP